MLQGIYSPYLVAISMLVAILAAYTALDMAERVRTAPDTRSANVWLVGGAFAMGFGIWSMHFIGMLAFELPIAVGYDIAMTAGSLAIAVASSALALKLVSLPELPPLRLALGAVLMGGGIAAMHYLGMAAMRMSPGILFSSGWVVLSLVIAVVASGAALWLQFSIRADTVQARFMRLVASLVMGLAIVGMHYTGMHAANFPLWSVCLATGQGLETGALAAVVTVVSISVLSIALVIAVLDARLASRTSMLASSLAQANQKLIQLALHDNLTRLPNRVLLQDRLEQMLEKASRRKLRFAVMFMDLDGFKAVNDAYGHHAGDQLLSKIGSRIQDALRARDTIARIGGDEFVAIIEVEEPTDAAETAERLTRVVDQSVQVVGHPVRVTASIGISLYPNDGTTAHGLLSNADAAMYHAKRASGNGYRFFETSMNANAQQQLELLSDLRAARDNGELLLQYQPKFMAPEGPIRGFEALLRWRHPKRGMVGPDLFIPLAEKNGLIVPIGEWVLNEACRQMRIWRQAGHSDWTIAVNLSPVQFAHEELVDLVSRTLVRHELPPSCLVLEVTEATAMRDTTASLRVLRRLSDLGVSISIDDFGTGYSSLLYLKRLPASELKIDRGFVRELGEGTEDAVIVSTIIALAQQLKLQVVAEGVETAAQQVFLTQAGCDQLQGYLLARPMSGTDALAMAG